MRLRLYLIAPLIVISVWANSIKDGIEELDKQNYKKAYEIFLELYKKDSSNSQVNFYLGRSAFELGKYQEAILAFERVLIVDPTHYRSRLELARSYIALNMLNEARSELAEVQKSNPPKDVAKNIDSLLELINQKRKKSLTTGNIALGVTYDTNINSNPGKDALIDYLQDAYNANKKDIQVKEDKLKSSSLTESLYVRNIYDIGDEGGLFFDSSMLAYNQNYAKYPKYDVTFLSLMPGVGYSSGANRWVLQFGYDYLNYAKEKLLNSYTIMPRYSHDFGDGINSSLYAKYQKKFYDKKIDKNKDAKLYEFGIDASKSFGKNRVIGTISYIKEEPNRGDKDKFVKKDAYSFKITYIREIINNTTLLAQYNIKKTFFDDTYKPNDNNKRDDWYNSALLNVNYQFNKNYSVSGGYNYISNLSDYKAGEYDKSVFLVNVVYGF